MSTTEKENKEQVLSQQQDWAGGRKEQAGGVSEETRGCDSMTDAWMSCEMPDSRHLEHPKCEWTTVWQKVLEVLKTGMTHETWYAWKEKVAGRISWVNPVACLPCPHLLLFGGRLSCEMGLWYYPI